LAARGANRLRCQDAAAGAAGAAIAGGGSSSPPSCGERKKDGGRETSGEDEIERGGRRQKHGRQHRQLEKLAYNLKEDIKNSACEF